MVVKTKKLELSRKHKAILIIHDNEQELREFAEKVNTTRLDYHMDYGDFYFDESREKWVAEFITARKHCNAASQNIRSMIDDNVA